MAGDARLCIIHLRAFKGARPVAIRARPRGPVFAMHLSVRTALLLVLGFLFVGPAAPARLGLKRVSAFCVQGAGARGRAPCGSRVGSLQQTSPYPNTRAGARCLDGLASADRSISAESSSPSALAAAQTLSA